jgi:hypothetical protein
VDPRRKAHVRTHVAEAIAHNLTQAQQGTAMV